MKPREGKHALSDKKHVLQFSDMSNFDTNRLNCVSCYSTGEVGLVPVCGSSREHRSPQSWVLGSGSLRGLAAEIHKLIKVAVLAQAFEHVAT